MRPGPLPFLLLLAASAASGKSDGGDLSLLQQALENGEWNQRILAVKQLGAMDPPPLAELRKALTDPDWQVRLSAVHWLSRAGPGAGPALQQALGSESCRLVRLGLVHALGSLGLSAAGPGRGEGLSRCESWSWPAAASSGRRAPAPALESTPADRRGCRYIRYKSPGRTPCPKGTAVQGVGPAPESVDFLSGQPPTTGVALCCPLDEKAAEPKAPEPQDVECRLVPLECPQGWTEMAPREDFNWSGKDMRYKRTYRLQEGDLPWVHCCRPHAAEEAQAPSPPEAEEAPAAIAPPAPAPPPARAPAPAAEPEAPAPPESAAPAPEPPRPPPVSRDLRLAELDALLDAAPEDLPRAKGLPDRGRLSRPGAEVELPARPLAQDQVPSALPGAEEKLPSPVGVPVRTSPAVRAPASVQPDGGTVSTHDPLPGLLAMLKHKSPRRRSRAADELGNLGRSGAPALSGLKAALRDSSPRVRASAALALGNITQGEDSAVAELKRALKDSHLDVRYSAAQALGRIGTRASSAAFNTYMRSEARTFLGR